MTVLGARGETPRGAENGEAFATGPSAFARRLFRGPGFSRLLERCGIEPRRYWILVDLFETLGARLELAGMGDAASMRAVTVIWFLLSIFISLVLVASGAAPGTYLGVFLALTVFQLGVVLVAEVAESLVNPVDGLVLAHQPVNGATWSGAKLTHLVRIVVYIVAGVNGAPALAGVLLSHPDAYSSLLYPPAHLAIALATGLLVALSCCGLFGWLVRFVPVRRLKAAAAVVQALPMLGIFGFRYLDDLLADVEARAAAIELPAAWSAAAAAVPGGLPALLGAGGAAVAGGVVFFGLRALSRDHLIRASSLMRSGARRRRGRRRPRVGPWIGRIAGGQPGRAGYEYLRALVFRDWQFLRSMAMNAAGLVVLFVGLPVAGLEASPFGSGFAPAHFLPHLLGMLVLIVCLFLAYGNDYKGVWSFGVVPDSAFRPFARGIHAALWLVLVALPSVFWLLVLAWFWGFRDAALFIAYCTAAASVYLGVCLRLIAGIPFGRQMAPSRQVATFGLFLVFFLAAAVAVALQYVLFRSVAAVVAVTLVTGAGAYLVTRVTVGDLASRMRAGLRPVASGSMFRFAHAEDA